ncbi:MAG: DUF2971 domain-containing protein [Stellaceae bacterium]
MSSALKILQNGTFWFTERTHLNDPTEIRLGLKIAQTVLDQMGLTIEAKALSSRADDIFRDFRFFSASFSLEGDDHAQWRDYGDSGRGIALSFNKFAFTDPKPYVDQIIGGNPTAFICPMSYGSYELRTVIESIIQKWSGRDLLELCDHVFMIAAMFKNDRWKVEREFRFFIHEKRHSIISNLRFQTRERNGDLVSYLDIPIQNWTSRDNFPLWKLTLGPMAAPGLKSQLEDVIFSQNLPIHPDFIVNSGSSGDINSADRIPGT